MSLSPEQLDRLADLIAQRLRQADDRRPLYTVASLADRLGLSQRTVRQLLADGVIPSFRVEGRRCVEPASVDAYLAACKAGDTRRAA